MTAAVFLLTAALWSLAWLLAGLVLGIYLGKLAYTTKEDDTHSKPTCVKPCKCPPGSRKARRHEYPAASNIVDECGCIKPGYELW